MNQVFYPGQLFMLLLFAFLVFIVVKNRMTLGEMIVALNAIGSQPIAILVMVLGCVMFKISYDMKADTNIAAGIIGCSIGLLNKQFGAKPEEAQKPLP